MHKMFIASKSSQRHLCETVMSNYKSKPHDGQSQPLER